MSIQWTILDDAGATLLADFGFANYVDLADRQPGQEVGKGSTTRTTRLSIGRAGESAVFFIKVYRYAGRQWRHRFRCDKASQEAANYSLLNEIGIGTPQVVAFGSRRSGLRLVDAIIVTRGLPDVVGLDRLFESRWPDATANAMNPHRQEVIHAVLREIRRMHDAGFFHIDLQWRNILIGGMSEGRTDVYLLDAPRGGMRRNRWTEAHGRLRDLSCLYKEARRRLSRTEQLRWLLLYLEEGSATPAARAMVDTLILDRVVKDNN